MKLWQLPCAVTKSKKSFLRWCPGSHGDKRGSLPPVGSDLSREADVTAQLIPQATCLPALHRPKERQWPCAISFSSNPRTPDVSACVTRRSQQWVEEQVHRGGLPVRQGTAASGPPENSLQLWLWGQRCHCDSLSTGRRPCVPRTVNYSKV